MFLNTNIDLIKSNMLFEIKQYVNEKEGIFRYYSFDTDARTELFTKNEILQNKITFESRRCSFKIMQSLEKHSLFFIEEKVSIQLALELGKKTTIELLNLVSYLSKSNYTYALAFSFNTIIQRNNTFDLNKIFNTFVNASLSESFISCFLNIEGNVKRSVSFIARKGVPQRVALKYLLFDNGEVAK